MKFIYRTWDAFCRDLSEAGMQSIPACEVTAQNIRYVVLKHDVETCVSHAYRMAQIEHRYGHRGSYYVQAYLMQKQKNIVLLQEMQRMGHEISYHHDVMDSNKGNLDAAVTEFEKNVSLFQSHGFFIKTVCQHGNPIVERIGYTSNRDFFRSEKARTMFPSISDIMVHYHQNVPTDFLYFSDAGRSFKRICDPFENDLNNSDDKNVTYTDLKDLFRGLSQTKGNIISVHPHRWTRFSLAVTAKTMMFRTIRSAAKFLENVPYFRRIMSKYYYLAKKI